MGVFLSPWTTGSWDRCNSCVGYTLYTVRGTTQSSCLKDLQSIAYHRFVAHDNSILTDRNRALPCRDGFPCFAQRHMLAPGTRDKPWRQLPERKQHGLDTAVQPQAASFMELETLRYCGTGWNATLSGLSFGLLVAVLAVLIIDIFFWGRVSLLYPQIASNLLCGRGWPQSSKPPDSISWMTALQACTITSCLCSAEESIQELCAC